MEYHLYPPFFVVDPQPAFDQAWEAFCCELLNLENRTNNIRRRLPPDLGCDLIWEAKKTVYQCKVVESGRSSVLSLDKVKKSIETAKNNKAKLGWRKYILCTNVDLTGSQEEKIKKMLPDIEFLTPSNCWIALCKKFPSAANSRCRQLAPIPQRAVVRAIDEIYLQDYAQELQKLLSTTPFTLLVYSNLRNDIIELPVSLEFSVDTILRILMRAFKLPNPRKYEDINIKVSLSYSLVINDKRVPLSEKLSNLSLPLDEKPLVTFWKTIVWKDEVGQTEVIAHELTTLESMNRKNLSPNDRSRIAIERYKQEIVLAFDQAIAGFETKKKRIILYNCYHAPSNNIKII
jgi:hypothetical protein